MTHKDLMEAVEKLKYVLSILDGCNGEAEIQTLIDAIESGFCDSGVYSTRHFAIPLDPETEE